MLRDYVAYLDIETTGLSPLFSDITVIGIYIENKFDEKFIQLIGDEVNKNNLMYIIERVHTIYTYNGSRFDLPFINMKLGINLENYALHYDLMYKCWKKGLFGGLKRVEKILGIERRLKEMDGRKAVILWNRFINNNDYNALALLLEYNKEDVMNLKILKEKLDHI